MATREHGHIKARNKETGVIWEIRPDMLDVMNHPWEVLNDEDIPTETPSVETLKKPAESNVIMKKDGAPFKTEDSARAAMTRMGLDENAFIVIKRADDEYVIQKV